MFQDSRIFVTANTIPKTIKEVGPRDEDEDGRRERNAFRKRIKFFDIPMCIDGSEEFPYDAKMLAKWLLYQYHQAIAP